MYTGVTALRSRGWYVVLYGGCVFTVNLTHCPLHWMLNENIVSLTHQAPSQAGRGIGRCWGWPPPHGAWGCPPLWASGKWHVCQRWDSTAGLLGGPFSPSGSWSIPWIGRKTREHQRRPTRRTKNSYMVLTESTHPKVNRVNWEKFLLRWLGWNSHWTLMKSESFLSECPLTKKQVNWLIRHSQRWNRLPVLHEL